MENFNFARTSWIKPYISKHGLTTAMHLSELSSIIMLELIFSSQACYLPQLKPKPTYPKIRSKLSNNIICEICYHS